MFPVATGEESRTRGRHSDPLRLDGRLIPACRIRNLRHNPNAPRTGDDSDRALSYLLTDLLLDFLTIGVCFEKSPVGIHCRPLPTLLKIIGLHRPEVP